MDLDIAATLQRKAQKQEQEQVTEAVEMTTTPPPHDNRNILLVLGVLVGIFLLAMVGFKAYGTLSSATVLDLDQLHQKNLEGGLEEEEGYIYNGFSFINADGLWWTELNKFGTRLKIPLHYGPKELEFLKPEGTFDSRFNEGDQIYVAIDPNVTNKYYTLAISELSFNIVKGMDREPVGSCTEANWQCENRTIINCENTQGKPVVELRYGGASKIELLGTCIRLTGSEYGVVQVVDRILYQWYGVMG